MRKTSLIGLFLSASLLAACNSGKEAATAETATPAPSTAVASTTSTPTSGSKAAQTSVNAQASTGSAQKAQTSSGKFTAQATVPGGSSGSMRTYYTDVSSTTRISTPGMDDQVTSTPAGLSVAYLFNGSQVKTRMNMPGSMFTDNRARIAVYDSAQQAARIVFADNMQADSSIDASQLAGFMNSMSNNGKINDGQPAYVSRSSSQFSSSMSAQGMNTQTATVTVNGTPTSVVQMSKTISLPHAQQQTTSSLDPNLGYVVQTVSRQTTSEANQQTTSDFTYQDVTGVNNVKWPSHVHSTTNTVATAVGLSSTGTQDIDYTGGQANTLSDSYFSIGGL